jgi:high affinity Mn2+ porin
MRACFSFGSKLWPVLAFSSMVGASLKAQTVSDSVKNDQSWNFHFQSTIIGQYHPAFQAKYSGQNSLNSKSESPVSMTGTFFFGTRLWKGATAYFNPEISGGSGFSQTRGVAGFPNGEVYRVSDAAPKVYIGRLFVRQLFPLSNEYRYVADNVNHIAQEEPTSYLAVYAGKYSIMDYFDDNRYSHDPRTQFFNWALMGNPAWDYPANTRGYTYGITLELVKPGWALRFATVLVPTTANGWIMDPVVSRSRAEALEFEHKYSLGNQSGTIHLISYLNEARMGNYKQAVSWGIAHDVVPAVDSVQHIGRTKYGLGINVEQSLTKNIGFFLRAGWNDGHNETWVFTEVDRHFSAGLNLNGVLWGRGDDNFGVAQIVNGLSNDHKDYLKAGGYGFIIGDGALTYGFEWISEMYYSFKFPRYGLWFSPDYQFIVDPAYNRDRGPMHALGLRVHVEL